MLSDKRFIIVSGTARNVGKTTVVCQLIDTLSKSNNNVIGLKFVTLKEGVSEWQHQHHEHIETFAIIEEKKTKPEKDTVRMLKAGASKSYLLISKPNYIKEALNSFLDLIATDDIVVAESATLRHYIKPKSFVIVDREEAINKKAYIDKLMPLADVWITNALDKCICTKVLGKL